MIGELEHVTINTGAARISARSEVDGAVVDHVRAGLAAGGSVGGGWAVTFVATPVGLHLYDLLHDGHVVATCLLCVDPRLSARAWIEVAGAGAAPAGVRLHEPTITPWLAAIITGDPTIAGDPAMFADILIEAGDLGRVVAWALID